MKATTQSKATAPKAKPRKATAPKGKLVTYTFDAIENGKMVHYELPVKAINEDTIATLVNADNELDDAIIGALFAGAKLPFYSGADFVKSINEAKKAKGEKGRVSKNDVKAGYDKFQAVARIREFTTEPIQPLWNAYTVKRIAERDAVKKENLALVANGENPKPLPRIAKPSVNGILKMLKPEVTVDHLQAFLKSAKTAYNHLLECKGAKAAQDAQKLAAIIVSNGGEVTV